MRQIALLAALVAMAGPDLGAGLQRSQPSAPRVKTIDVDQRERARRKQQEKNLRRLQRTKR